MRKRITGFLFCILISGIFGQTQEQWIRIERENCPVYSRITRISSDIISTVQKGFTYRVLDMNTDNYYGRPFYQINVNSQQTGWIYGEDATLFFKDAAESRSQAGEETTLKPSLERLLRIYNDKTAELAVAYGLRSFPEFTLDMSDSLDQSYDGTFEIHLQCNEEEKRLFLKTADQFLFQLITHEVFDKTPYTLENLIIVITFGENADHTRLKISRDRWQNVAMATPGVFWQEAVTSVDKDQLWRY
jgi:hypothetical protein